MHLFFRSGQCDTGDNFLHLNISIITLYGDLIEREHNISDRASVKTEAYVFKKKAKLAG